MADPADGLSPAWKNSVNQALKDSAWDAYDNDIVSTVAAYNRFLANKASYVPLQPKLVKAMVWVESGGPQSPAWNGAVMQIGNAGDPGLAALLSAKGNGKLVVPPELYRQFSTTAVRSNPVMNIQAGTGLLLLRMAEYAPVTTLDADRTIHDHKVAKGESPALIARKEGSTLDVVNSLNPGLLKKFSIGMVVHTQKATRALGIVGWRPWSTGNIAARYNGGGDSTYAAKLNYCLGLMQQKEAAAAQKAKGK